MYAFRMSVSSISQIVPHVCNALYDVLEEDYLNLPKNEKQWKKLAEDFALSGSFHMHLSKKDKNYLQHDSMDQEDELGNVTPGRWRNAIEEVCNIRNDPGMRPSTTNAREIRDDIKDHFFEEGSVDFQWKMTE